jgi:hypothetical protein
MPDMRLETSHYVKAMPPSANWMKTATVGENTLNTPRSLSEGKLVPPELGGTQAVDGHASEHYPCGVAVAIRLVIADWLLIVPAQM